MIRFPLYRSERKIDVSTPGPMSSRLFSVEGKTYPDFLRKDGRPVNPGLRRINGRNCPRHLLLMVFWYKSADSSEESSDLLDKKWILWRKLRKKFWTCGEAKQKTPEEKGQKEEHEYGKQKFRFPVRKSALCHGCQHRTISSAQMSAFPR